MYNNYNNLVPLDLKPDEILKALNLFHPAGSLFEIRALNGKGKISSAYFTDNQKAVQVLQATKFPVETQVYFTFNELNPACGSREQIDHFVLCPKTTTDKDVINYRWIMIDLDPVRTVGVSSTDEEKRKAFEKANELKQHLNEAGFSEPVIMSSGNGTHLFYKTCFPADEGNTEMMKKFIDCLNRDFSSESIDIDKAVFNPSRITKLYGTKARKGADTDNRPHRYSKIVQIPDNLQETDISIIRKYVADHSEQEETKMAEKKKPAFIGGGFNVVDFLNRYNIDFNVKPDGDSTKYLMTCPFCNNTGSAVIEYANGKIIYKCQHNSCTDKKWSDFRGFYEPEYLTGRQWSRKSTSRDFSSVTSSELIDPAFLTTFIDMPETDRIIAKVNLKERAKELKMTGSFNTVWDTVSKKCSSGSETETPEFIVRDGNREKVNSDLLQKYFVDHNHLLWVKGSGSNSYLLFIYDKCGAYKELSRENLKGRLIKIIQNYARGIDYTKEVNNAVGNIFAVAENVITFDELNADETIINLKNGILHIDGPEMTLTEHSPEYYSTVQLPITWADEDINQAIKNAPVFEKYLQDLTSGNDKLSRLIRQYVGAILSNVQGWKYKRALFMCGEGDTGKSVIFNLIKMIVGSDNTCITSLSGLQERFGQAYLFGKRFAGDPDMKYAKISEIDKFKAITGGDPIFMERKGEQGFFSVYRGFLWFNCNRMPLFGGDKGEHVYDRFIIVPCTNKIPEDKRDGDLISKLYGERNSIFKICLYYFKSTIKHNGNTTKYVFAVPDICKDELKKYRILNSSALTFYEECCADRISDTITGEDTETTTFIHRAYTQWCKENGVKYPSSVRDFKTELSGHLKCDPNMLTKKSNGHEYYKFKLNADAYDKYRYC